MNRSKYTRNNWGDHEHTEAVWARRDQQEKQHRLYASEAQQRSAFLPDERDCEPTGGVMAIGLTSLALIGIFSAGVVFGKFWF